MLIPSAKKTVLRETFTVELEDDINAAIQGFDYKIKVVDQGVRVLVKLIPLEVTGKQVPSIDLSIPRVNTVKELFENKLSSFALMFINIRQKTGTLVTTETHQRYFAQRKLLYLGVGLKPTSPPSDLIRKILHSESIKFGWFYKPDNSMDAIGNSKTTTSILLDLGSG